jgi:hypothetical protein
MKHNEACRIMIFIMALTNVHGTFSLKNKISGDQLGY